MDHPIVFYDGTCGLCNRSVQLLIKMDQKGTFRYAPLQGNAARALLEDALWKEVNTFVLYTSHGLFLKSEAFFEAMKLLGGKWRLLSVFRIFPLWIRNSVYDWVARNRFRLFKQYDHCLIPSDKHSSLFLE